MLEGVLIDEAAESGSEGAVVEYFLLDLGEFVQVEGPLPVRTRHLHVGELARVRQDTPGMPDNLLPRLPVVVRVHVLHQRDHLPSEETIS